MKNSIVGAWGKSGSRKGAKPQRMRCPRRNLCAFAPLREFLPGLFQHALGFLCLWMLQLSAIPQTATDPNEGTRLISLGNNSFQFTWWGRAEKSYLVEFSDDLANWTYISP